MTDLRIHSEYITLGQFLKMINAISSGGMAKWYLDEHVVYINGEQEQRRGKKLRDGDVITVPEFGKFKIIEDLDGTTDAN